MALTETEIQKAKQLQSDGYKANEIKEILGAQRAGRPSVIMQEIDKRSKLAEESANNNFDWQKVVASPAKYLASSAVDTFGSGLARRGLGTDTEADIVKDYIDEPTARQYAGAILQTAGLAADVGLTVGSLGAAAPATLGRNVALGAGLGYVYDVGEDLVAQERMVDTLMPGFGTVVGGAAPAVFTGLGAAYRSVRPAQEGAEMVADDVARAAAPAIRETTDSVGERAVEETAEQAGSSVQEFSRSAFNRFSRAGRHLQEEAQDKAARNVLRQDASPAVNFALDEGIETNTIMRIEQADDVARGAYRAVVEAAESNDPKNAELVAGEYARDMYKIARAKQSEIGKKLGEARRALGNDIVDESIYNPAMRTFGKNMRDNGIRLNRDGSVSFDTVKYTDEQERVIENIWKRLNKFDTITPSEVDEVMQYLSRLEYQTNVADKIDNVYIDVIDQKTGQVQPENVFRHIRNTFDSMLEQVDTTGQIKNLRRQYSQAKSVTGEVENNWFRGLDIRKATDEDLADRASLALRRLDSRAQSRTTYGQMYRALEKYARGNGYEGADAADVSNFYIKEVQPLYSESVPEASFRGDIVGGIRSAIGNVFDFGKANADDRRKAIRGLLDMEDAVPVRANPASAAPEETAQTEKVRQLTERLRESSNNNTPDYLRNNRQAGFANFFGGGRKSITPQSVAEQMDGEDFDIVAQLIEDVPNARLNPGYNRLIREMGLNKADDAELTRFLREVTDEFEQLNPPGKNK